MWTHLSCHPPSQVLHHHCKGLACRSLRILCFSQLLLTVYLANRYGALYYAHHNQPNGLPLPLCQPYCFYCHEPTLYNPTQASLGDWVVLCLKPCMECSHLVPSWTCSSLGTLHAVKPPPINNEVNLQPRASLVPSPSKSSSDVQRLCSPEGCCC